MDCSSFSEILADYIEGTLSSDLQSAAEAHLENCTSCSALSNLACGKFTISHGGDSLTQSILDNTSGPVCRSAESQLWEYVGGEMEETQAELVSLHLEHCPGCRALAGEMALLQQELPSMAEIDPGEAFTREVLRKTTGKFNRSTTFKAWWDRVVQRPRFPLEAAYAGTLILVLLFNCLPLRNLEVGRLPYASLEQPSRQVQSKLAGAMIPALDHVQAATTSVQSGKDAAFQLAAGLSEKASSFVIRQAVNVSNWASYGLSRFAEMRKKVADRLIVQRS